MKIPKWVTKVCYVLIALCLLYFAFSYGLIVGGFQTAAFSTGHEEVCTSIINGTYVNSTGHCIANGIGDFCYTPKGMPMVICMNETASFKEHFASILALNVPLEAYYE